MAFPNQEQIDIIATQILLDAKQAISQLKAWNNSVKDAQDRTAFLKELIKSTAKQLNGDFKAATASVASFSKALQIDPRYIKQVGKELQITAKTAEQLGMSFEAAEKKIAGIAIVLAGGTGEVVTFGVAFRMAISSGLPLLTAMQVALSVISGQIALIKGQMSGIGSGSRATPLLGSGGAGGNGGEGIIDAQWEEVGNSANKAAGAMENAGKAGEEAGKKTEGGFKKAALAINVVRIALGVLVSMLIFQVIQGIQNAFKTMIDNVRESELAIYNLINAERRLSEQGIGITPKDLDEIIKRLREINPILSQIQAQELVSRISSNVAPALKLTKEQIEQMAVATSLLYIRNKALGKSFDEVESQLTNAFLTGKVSQGINQLGVKISDQIVKDEALRLGLVKTADEFDKLDGEMAAHVKAVAMLSVVYKNATQDQQSVAEYMKTTDAQIELSKKSWNDLLTVLGQVAAPILIKVFELAAQSLQGWLMFFEKTKPAMVGFFSLLAGFLKAIEELMKNPFISMTEFFQNVQKFAGEAFTNGMKNLANSADTATSSIQDMYASIEDTQDVEKALADIEQQIQGIILDAQQAQDDLNLKLQQKEQDLNTEYLRKQEDAARDHAQKLSDIDLDARRKAEDAKAKLREDEKKAEQDLLQKLKELRERFLLDLEDALHKRDARQVLRLIKEYKLEKQNILDRQKLDEQQRKDKLAQDLADIELERKRRIENENLEYQRKLSDLREAKAREEEELQLWYKREQDDIQRNVEQKLQKLLAGYIAEGKIHETEQARIYAILQKYFGKDMALVDSLAQFMAGRFAQMGSLQQFAMSSIIGGAAAAGLAGAMVGAQMPTSKGTKGGRQMAEGGTIFARKPTTVTFGEAGPEIGSFTPINRSGNDVGKMFGDVSGGGINGRIVVAVDLSPDLEGRIVEHSMNGVADVVGRVNRRKI